MSYPIFTCFAQTHIKGAHHPPHELKDYRELLEVPHRKLFQAFGRRKFTDSNPVVKRFMEIPLQQIIEE